MTTLSEFEDMCRRHDLTYDFSDDRRAYARGRKSYEAIRGAALEIGMATASRIWNKVVRDKINEPHVGQFLWPEKPTGKQRGDDEKGDTDE